MNSPSRAKWWKSWGNTFVVEDPHPFNIEDVEWHGERNKDGIGSVLRLVRNALAHRRVTLDGESFVFADQNKRCGENAHTTARLSWAQLGRLTEAVIFALDPLLYPAGR